MSDIEDQAAERVSKAARINDEVYNRLHQYDKEGFGLTEKPAPKAKKAKATEGVDTP